MTEELVDSRYQRFKMLWFSNECYHAIRLPGFLVGFPCPFTHYLSSSSNHLYGERIIKVTASNQRCIFSQAVSECDIDYFFRFESKFFFKDSKDHDRRGHDSWLGIFRLIEQGIRAFDNGSG